MKEGSLEVKLAKVQAKVDELTLLFIQLQGFIIGIGIGIVTY